MSLVIFLYMFIVLVVFIFVKKQEFFKCFHPSHISTTCSRLSQRISDIRVSKTFLIQNEYLYLTITGRAGGLIRMEKDFKKIVWDRSCEFLQVFVTL